jgi:hypothetical protein
MTCGRVFMKCQVARTWKEADKPSMEPYCKNRSWRLCIAYVCSLFNWRHWFTRKKRVWVPSNICEWICTRDEHEIPRVLSLTLTGLTGQLYYRTTAALYKSPISIMHRPSCPRIILKINFTVHVERLAPHIMWNTAILSRAVNKGL